MDIKTHPTAAVTGLSGRRSLKQHHDTVLRTLRQLRQPLPTVQSVAASSAVAERSAQCVPVTQRTRGAEFRWFTAENSPANPALAPKFLPVSRPRARRTHWTQRSMLILLLLLQMMRRLRQMLWRETQRLSRLMLARWRQQRHRRREGRAR